MAKALKMVFILIALLNTTVSLFPLKGDRRQDHHDKRCQFNSASR